MRTIIRRTLLCATATLAAALPAAGAAHADPFGVTPGTFSVSAPGAAGTHPDVKIAFEITRKDSAGDAQLPPAPSGEEQSYGPSASVRDLELALPPGLVANPAIAPVCPMGDIIGLACPREAAIGEVHSRLFFPGDGAIGGINEFGIDPRLFRTNPLPGELVAFGTQIAAVPVRMGVSVGPDGGYRITTRIRGLNETAALIDTRITLWGIPADHQGPPTDPNSFDAFGGPLRDEDGNLAPRRAFTTLATACDGAPQRASLTLTSWQGHITAPTVEAALPAATGCADLPFDPAIAVASSSARAGEPAGYTVTLSVPQPWTAPVGDGVDPAPATAHLDDVSVTLPQGVAISPAGADGLGACSDEQLAITSDADETCPASSRIGTVKLESPVLDAPVDGVIYLGTQKSQDPASGDMYRLFLTATTNGLKLKLRGAIAADPVTGRLTATFRDNPQLPFSKLTLTFKDGPRAPLVNPAACGTFTTTASLTGHGGQARQASSDGVRITQDCETGGGFAPGFVAGVLNPAAGAHSAFTLRATRHAGAPLSRIDAVLPAGLLANLKDVPRCDDAAAAAGRCPAASRIGGVTVAAGAGASPLVLPQPGKAPTSVSLAGPYKGAPLSLSIVVPAQAGPLDLGTVVVRATLDVDPRTAQVTVKSDPLPTIVGGVPLNLREVRVDIDRAGFMLNPTSCARQSVAGTLTGAPAGSLTAASPFQITGCGALPFRPRMALALSGKGQTTDGKHPALSATLTQAPGEANLRKVAVTLPLALALEPGNAEALCEPADAAANRCPAKSVIGRASLVTPILSGRLTGPVFFVRGERKDPKTGRTVKTLPKLYVPLTATDYPGLRIDLNGTSEVVDEHLVATFDAIPDAPVGRFDLQVDGGKHGVLVVSSANLCQGTQRAAVDTDGQNGRRADSEVVVATPCRLGIVASRRTSTAVRLTLGGVGAGKVTISGRGLKTTRRTVKEETTVTLSVPLTKATRALLARGRDLRTTVKVRFAPAAGKATSITERLVVHGASSRRADQGRS